MKSHADALAELAKAFPQVAKIREGLESEGWFKLEFTHRSIVQVLDLAATEHAQRKQLESRVEKLRVALDMYAIERRTRLSPGFAQAALAADDALAKEQPKC